MVQWHSKCKDGIGHNMKKPTQQERLTQVEIDTKVIRSDIDTIKNNHLAHIESTMGSMDRKIEKLDTRLWGILIILVASVFIPFVTKLW